MSESITPCANPGLIRRMLLALLLLGTFALLIELVLLEHTESTLQWIPFVVLAVGLASGIWIAIRPGPLAIRVFQLMMLVFIATGVTGIVLHNVGNVAFEREIEPTVAGLTLMWRSLRGATPALAPGAVAQLGLLGLILAYRHPALVTHATTEHDHVTSPDDCPATRDVSVRRLPGRFRRDDGNH